MSKAGQRFPTVNSKKCTSTHAHTKKGDTEVLLKTCGRGNDLDVRVGSN